MTEFLHPDVLTRLRAYLAMCPGADPQQNVLLEEAAVEIERLQRRILALEAEVNQLRTLQEVTNQALIAVTLARGNPSP